MTDESVKVQMFRFVDVLPMLHSHESITQHLQEYFDEVRNHLPWAVRLGFEISQPNTVLGKALALNARRNAMRMSQRFIAGAKVEEVLQAVSRLRKQGFAFTLDLLGEATTSERDADAYQEAYLKLIDGLSREVNAWSEVASLDRDQEGPIPRVNVSLKLSALYSQFRPIDPVGTRPRPLRDASSPAALRPQARRAYRQRRHGAVLPQGPHARDLQRHPDGGRIPATFRTSASSCRPISPKPSRRPRPTCSNGRRNAARRFGCGSSRGPIGTTRRSFAKPGTGRFPSISKNGSPTRTSSG